MKHKLIRIGAALLALVLLAGALPTALAAESGFEPSRWWENWYWDQNGSPRAGYVSIQPKKDQLVLNGWNVSTEIDVNCYGPDGFRQTQPKIELDVVSGSGGSISGKTFTATSADDFVIKATVTFYADNNVNDTRVVEERCTIHVYKSDYKVTIDPTELVLPVGQTKGISVSVQDPMGNNVNSNAYYINWSKDRENVDINTYSSYCEVTGYQAGPVTLTATVTVGNKSYPVSCKITVTNGEVVCNPETRSAEVGKTLVLRPSVSNSSFRDVTYDYRVVSGKATVTPNSNFWGVVADSATVSADKAGLVQVEITAKSNGTTIGSTTVTLSFYDTVNLDAQLKNSQNAITFSDKEVFYRVKRNTETITSRFDSLASYMTTVAYPRDCYINFSVSSYSKGTLSGPTRDLREIPMTRLGEMKFTPAGGTLQADFTVYDGETKLPLTQGTLTLRSGGLAGDITYSTDYDTAITLKPADFQDFWAKVTGKTKSSLAYVTFSPSSSDWGTLYTKKNGDKVTSRMEFSPNGDSRYYDLSTVTYVPYKEKLTSYTDSLAFTACGLDGTTVEGQVMIYLNSSTGNAITSRGVVFGTANLTKVLQETFRQNRDADLAYVTFYLPEAEEGTLYYNFSSALNKNLVRTDRQYYVSPDKNDKNQYSLDLVAFVPAAGTYGKITLYYKGFDKTGEISYSGALTLTVNQKSASAAFSDITAKSYSWAADSVDFLYYEEVAQGSGGKYNPGSNITRGDFMLMLYRAFLQPNYKDYKVTDNFSDVKKGTSDYSKETYQAVGVAKHLGIAKGSNGKFNPNSRITREEAMTLIYRTMEELKWTLSYESGARASSFSDYGSVSSYAKDAITVLVSRGVILGSNGKITPKSNITRAEMACILHRVLTY